MGTDNGGINEDIFRYLIFFLLECVPSLFPDVALFPSSESILHRIPMTKTCRQISPGNPCASDVQNGFYKHAVALLGRSTSFVLDPFQDIGNVLPYFISEHESSAGHPLSP
jgi:hypothetical protein